MILAFNTPSTQSCKHCSYSLAPDALECPQCQALVHGDALQRLAADANALEAAPSCLSGLAGSGGGFAEALRQFLIAVVIRSD